MPLCNDPENHTLAACAVLHSRCLNCSCRGHRAGDCANYTPQELRDIFRQYAGAGRYTRKQYDNPAWSFYPLLFEDYYDPTVLEVTAANATIDELYELEPAAARAKVIRFNASVRDRLGHPGIMPAGSTDLEVFTGLPSP